MIEIWSIIPTSLSVALATLTLSKTSKGHHVAIANIAIQLHGHLAKYLIVI